ncbi:geranylgeranyl reductase family protein [[Eubacterium] cellulosolvens]
MSLPQADIIVVGAGPAGLQAAIAAAGRGASVLVFDKKTAIGVPVRCGEFFPRKEEMLNLLPGSEDLGHLFEMPSDAISNVCERLRIYSPLGKCWEFPFRAYVLDRVILEQRLAEEASMLGVQFRLGYTVRVFENSGRVAVGPTRPESVEAKVVIAADGFPSVTASTAGLDSDRYDVRRNVAINYQYLIEDLSIESDVTEMYTGTSIAPGGYGWIIPKSRSAANVGVGVRTLFMKAGKARDSLDHFVYRYHLTADKLRSGRIRTMIADVLPIDGAISRTYRSRMLSVGDSAGMVMPTNGGGIPTAMVSGHIAGDVAALHVERDEPLSNYEVRWKKALGRELTASTRMRRFADVFMHHDRLFDCTMRILGTDGIKKVLTCKIPSGVDIVMRLLGY